VKRVVTGLDAPGMTGRQAATELEAIAAIKRLLAGAELSLAHRVDETQAWRGSGATTSGEWLARVEGTSKADARRVLDTAARLDDQPLLADAARRGELSERQLAAVSDAAAVAPGAAERLVRHAQGRSLRELQEECDRTKAAADRDAEARRARLHAQRSLRTWTAPDGAFKLLWTTTPEAGAELLARLKPFRDAEFARARAEGRRDAPDAYDADALLAMSRAGSGAREADADGGTDQVGLPAKVIARCDWGAVRRGHLHEGEVCEIAGVGPVAPSVIAELIDRGDTLLAAVLTDGVEVQRVVHAGRKLTAAQRTAMEWRDPQCVVLGCDRRLRLEVDHRDDYAVSGHTTLSELEWKCEPHHDLKTYQGWQLEPGVGPRRLLPPDHPDYPGDPRGSPPPGRRRRSDGTVGAFPVLVAQQAGVELAGGVAGQLVEEVDGARHLESGQVLAGEGQDLRLELG
jgi:hypothetical protein